MDDKDVASRQSGFSQGGESKLASGGQIIKDALAQDTEAEAVARSILGTSDAFKVANEVSTFVRAHLRGQVIECFFCELSIGAVFGLRLDDGRQVALKAQRPSVSQRFLRSVSRTQSFLADRAFPAPRPLLEPTRFGVGHATVEEYVTGDHGDAHQPAIRRAMATALARLVTLGNELPESLRADLPASRGLASKNLWPTPHSVLFDFEATAKGAEWIDELAREAKQTLSRRSARRVLGHDDWSVKQFRFDRGEIAAIYDWDSLMVEAETVVVANAAAHFPQTWYVDVSPVPDRDETDLFIEDYQAARGQRFTRDEMAELQAALIYTHAYTARCEHANDPNGEKLVGSHREILRSLRASRRD